MNPSMDNLNSELTGFGAANAQEIEQLQKALSVGSEYASQTPGTLTQGAALAVEDLDRTLKLVTFSMEHIKLWKDIGKEKVTQTVHEYNVQNSYGQEVPVFFQMGSTPSETDAQYARDVAIVKYLGTQGQVQHNLTLIQAAHGPVIAREVKNKTIELLQRNERAMFNADSSINALEYDGIYAQISNKQNQSKYNSTAFAGYEGIGIDDSVIIDMRQRDDLLDEDSCEEACLRAVNNFGMPMDMYLSTDIHSDFSRAFYAKQVVRPGDRTAAGYLVPEFVGTLNFRFKGNLFNRPRRAPLSASVSASSAPTLGNLTQASDAASKFGASDAGTYGYQVSAVYADGETLPSSEKTISVTAGDHVAGPLTYSGSPVYFNVFRTQLNAAGSDWEFIGRVAPVGSGSSHVLDLNVKAPGRGSAFLLMNDPDALVFKQLGSMIKYDLAVTDTSYRWLQLLYGMVLIQAPRKHIILDNIALSRDLASA